MGNLKIEIGMAMLEVVHGASSNNGTGSKGSLRFRVLTDGAVTALEEALGQHAFRLSFAKVEIEGVTVGGVSGRPDEDGLPKSILTFVVPQTSVVDSAGLMSYLGTTGTLILDEDQLSIDLTARA